MTAPFPVLPLILFCLPGLVAVVGLCSLGLVPRESRMLAALGLFTLVLAALLEVLLYTTLFQVLAMNGLYEVTVLLNHLSRTMVAVGFVFLALAATRRRSGLVDRADSPFPGGV